MQGEEGEDGGGEEVAGEQAGRGGVHGARRRPQAAAHPRARAVEPGAHAGGQGAAPCRRAAHGRRARHPGSTASIHQQEKKTLHE